MCPFHTQSVISPKQCPFLVNTRLFQMIKGRLPVHQVGVRVCLIKHQLVSVVGVIINTGGILSYSRLSSIAVGQSSIVNQLAALSGCIQHNDKEETLHQYKGKGGPATFCPSGGTNSLGVNEDTNVRYDHWVYDVAKRECCIIVLHVYIVLNIITSYINCNLYRAWICYVLWRGVLL